MLPGSRETGENQRMADVIEWLLAGDPSIQWQVERDLLGRPKSVWGRTRRGVAREGWGAALLAKQEESGRWGGGLYSPKWISTTYTLLLLRRLGLAPSNGAARNGVRLLLDRGDYFDGAISFGVTQKRPDQCVNGMVAALASYFRVVDERVVGIADRLLADQLADGGWNCEAWSGSRHGSFHTGISVLEGLAEYNRAARSDRVATAHQRGIEFFLDHRLYHSHRTGEVVHPGFTRFSFPPRWHFDALRGLEHFAAVEAAPDERLADAVNLVRTKRRRDGTWPLQNRHAGRTYFDMEQPGQPSRWNTVRALRVLAWWGGSIPFADQPRR